MPRGCSAFWFKQFTEKALIGSSGDALITLVLSVAALMSHV